MKREFNALQKTLSVMTVASILLGSVPTAFAQEIPAEAKWTEETTAYGFNLIHNEDGKTLGYTPESGMAILTVDGLAFKDMSGDGELTPYEDWRLPAEERAADLAARLNPQEIGGLMCFSAHQRECPEELTDAQKEFLDLGVRAVLNAASAVDDHAQITWANLMQSYCEGKGFSIPINFSTDPRNGANVSNWPNNLGLAATFDPEIAKEAGACMSKELRDLGITTFLGPQVDIASDPRWQRFSGTFGEDPALARDMTRGLIDGLQSSFSADGEDLGWADDSVASMVKHWTGEGAGEYGREAHIEYGKYAVYNNDNFDALLIPFVDGAFSLDGKTESAASVMSSYTIAWSDDLRYGELVGSGFSEYKIKELLRDKYGFKGPVCTDWMVINDYNGESGNFRCWGYEDNEKWNPASRAFEAVKVGISQIGGCNDSNVLVEAYNTAVEQEGQEVADAYFEGVARDLLTPYFTLGLFENPYLMVEERFADVNSEDKQAAAMDAQTKAIVLLKNHDNVIKAKESDEKPTVYVPLVYTPAYELCNAGNRYGAPSQVPASYKLPIEWNTLTEYFNVVYDKVADPWTGEPDADGNPTLKEEDITRATAEEIAACDFVLVVATAPVNYSARGGVNAEGEYVPLSVQYRPYTADNEFVRQESFGGDILADGTKENRGYYGKTSSVVNENMLDQILDASAKAKEAGIPCIGILDITQPMCVHEFESELDAILVSMSSCPAAALKIVTGEVEPSGLLPMQMPLDMLEVEKQSEDTPRDMVCYTDADGNTYDFAYGMNWSGVINDARTEKYSAPALTTPENQGVTAE